MLDIALATVLAWIGFIFFRGPIKKGDKSLNIYIPIVSKIIDFHEDSLEKGSW